MQSIVSECCQDLTMKHLLKPVIFPAYDRIKNRPFYFDKDIHANVKISDVIMSTTAIPTYFESHKVKIDDDLHDFLDSCMISNDASTLVLLKSTSVYKIDKSKIFLLNLGTGIFPYTQNDKNGLLSWLPNIASTIVAGSEANNLYELSLSLSSENYYMLDIELNNVYQPDDIRDSTIKYYITAVEEWIKKNGEKLDWICQKLLNNLQI